MQTLNLTTRKYELISQVMRVETEKNIHKIEVFFDTLFYKQVYQKKYNEEIFKPLRENITIEEMVKEQNYTGFDRDYFDILVKELDIQEPIEELLNQLTK